MTLEAINTADSGALGTAPPNSSPRKIALVGTAPNGKFAPFDDPSWEIWGVGLRAPYVTRANRWYEVHRLDGEPPQWAAEWRRLMRESCQDCEIRMLYPEPLGPCVKQIPSADIVRRFGTYFLSSSFAWMMADAILLMPGEIGLWGVDMEYGTEYRSQRAGLHHFKLLADALGIKVRHLLSSGIAYQPIPYPLIQDDPVMAKANWRRGVYEEKRKDKEAIVAGLVTQIAKNEGAIAELRDPPADPAARIAALEKMNAALLKQKAESEMLLALIKAKDEEMAWLQDYLVP